jgi:hypothetical protein
MKRHPKPKRHKWAIRAVLVLLLLCVIGILGWCRWVYVQIERYAVLDQVAQVA